jgi:hypothetical protein
MSTAKAQFPGPDPVDSNAPAAGCELETVDCLSCGAPDSDTVVIAPDPVTGLGGNFRVVRCRDCGLTYTNPRPTLASIGQFYPHDYAPHIAAVQHDGWLVRRRNAAIAAWLRCRFGFPPQPTSLLTRLSGSLAGLLSNRRKRRLVSPSISFLVRSSMASVRQDLKITWVGECSCRPRMQTPRLRLRPSVKATARVASASGSTVQSTSPLLNSGTVRRVELSLGSSRSWPRSSAFRQTGCGNSTSGAARSGDCCSENRAFTSVARNAALR